MSGRSKAATRPESFRPISVASAVSRRGGRKQDGTCSRRIAFSAGTPARTDHPRNRRHPSVCPRMQQANGNGAPVSPRKKQRTSTGGGSISKVTVVLGAQWGDEGKGKVVDMLAMDADVVCRCQVCVYPSLSADSRDVDATSRLLGRWRTESVPRKLRE